MILTTLKATVASTGKHTLLEPTFPFCQFFVVIVQCLKFLAFVTISVVIVDSRNTEMQKWEEHLCAFYIDWVFILSLS
jgi:hypothetical protein